MTIKTIMFWAVIVISATLLWQVVRSGSKGSPVPDISYSRFLIEIANGEVSKVTIAGNMVQGFDNKGGSFRVFVPANQSEMIAALQQHGVEIWFKETPDQSWPNWILNLAPLILLGALWFFMIRQMRTRRAAAQPGISGSVPTQGTAPRFGP
jgi:cell division protease FtsH